MALGHRVAELAGPGGLADDVQQVAVLAGGLVGPLAGLAGRDEADVQRAAGGALDVAADPVAALLAAARQVVAAHRLGVARKRGGQFGGVHAGAPGA